MYSGNDLIQITLNSILCSGSAALFSFFFSLPLSLYLIYNEFRAKKFVLILIRALMSVPAVSIGLILYFLITAIEPLRKIDLLFTKQAIIIAQAVLGLPLAAALLYEGLKIKAPQVKELTRSLGGNSLMIYRMLFKEELVFAAFTFVAVFSRLVGETGMSLMVGGNIKGYTQLLTTTVALETMRGEYSIAAILGIILLILGFGVNFSFMIIFRSKDEN